MGYFPVQITLELTDSVTVVETVTGLFNRTNLTLTDPPLVSINCSANCGDRVLLTDGSLNITVSVSLSLRLRYLYDFHIVFT